MKSSDEESPLSKNNAHICLVRNAMEQATLSKEVQQLQKERNSEERSFLKTKEHLLQQQSLRIGHRGHGFEMSHDTVMKNRCLLAA